MKYSNKQEALGAYILSLRHGQIGVLCKNRLQAICKFLHSDYELTKKGFREYVKHNYSTLYNKDRDHLLDFLYFLGIRFGAERVRQDKIVKPLSEVDEANKERISDFIRWCSEQRDYSAASYRMKSDHLKKYFRYFNVFNNENCRSFIATMEADNLKPATLNAYCLTLIQYGKYLKKPISLKKVAITRTLSTENIPTEKEYKAFLEWLDTNGKKEMYFIVKALGMTGMRRSELRQITYSDIISGEAYPLCKGKKRRLIYFPKQFSKEVADYVLREGIDKDDKIIGVSHFGVEISERGLDQKMKTLARKAGYPLKKAHCHAFRHFFAKQYLAKTKDVVQLAELMGHESVDTTRIYLQKSKEEQKRDINKNIVW